MHKRVFFILSAPILVFLLACQAAAGLPNPFATATPTSTPTFTPSPTPSPTPTATFTPTPLPTGTTKQAQPDGSTLFIDYDKHYEVTFPADWRVTSLSASDLDSLLNAASKTNPGVSHLVDSIRSMDPHIFRVFAFNFQGGHIVNGFTPTIVVTAESNSLINAMTLQDLLDVTVQSIPQAAKGTQLISDKLDKTDSGIPYGMLEANSTETTYSGSQVRPYEEVILFKLPGVAISLNMAVPASFQQEFAPDFVTLINSFKTLGN
jgi:hypothetical protein